MIKLHALILSIAVTSALASCSSVDDYPVDCEGDTCDAFDDAAPSLRFCLARFEERSKAQDDNDDRVAALKQEAAAHQALRQCVTVLSNRKFTERERLVNDPGRLRDFATATAESILCEFIELAEEPVLDDESDRNKEARALRVAEVGLSKARCQSDLAIAVSLTVQLSTVGSLRKLKERLKKLDVSMADLGGGEKHPYRRSCWKSFDLASETLSDDFGSIDLMQTMKKCLRDDINAFKTADTVNAVEATHTFNAEHLCRAIDARLDGFETKMFRATCDVVLADWRARALAAITAL